MAVLAGLMLLNSLGVTGQNAAIAGMVATALAHRQFGTPTQASIDPPNHTLE
jgi:hypothetical protein